LILASPCSGHTVPGGDELELRSPHHHRRPLFSSQGALPGPSNSEERPGPLSPTSAFQGSQFGQRVLYHTETPCQPPQSPFCGLFSAPSSLRLARLWRGEAG